MAVDSSGSQYVAGSTDSPDFPLTSTALGAPLGNQRLRFCHQVQSDGYRNRVFHLCGQLDNPGLRHGCQQDIYLAVTQSVLRGESYAVLKLDPSGQHILYNTPIGATTPESMAVDASGNVYLAGSAGPGFVTTPGHTSPNSVLE